jgi:hypothetical protein
MIYIECNPNVKVGFKMHVEIICLKMKVINYIYCFQNVILFGKFWEAGFELEFQV